MPDIDVYLNRLINKYYIAIGNKYGYLTVKSLIGKTKENYGFTVECVCVCGNVVDVAPSKLTANKPISCGCKNRGHNYYEKSDIDICLHYVIFTYKKSAKNKVIQFELSNEEVKQLLLSPCYYCGKPYDIRYYKNKKYKVNGVDRLDNSIGYTKANSVSCCKFCNRTKSNYDVEVFLKRIKRIYEHQGLQNFYPTNKGCIG